MSEMDGMPGLEAIKAVGCWICGKTTVTELERPQKESVTKSLFKIRSWPIEIL